MFLLFLFVSVRCDKGEVLRQLVPYISQSMRGRKKTSGRKFLFTSSYKVLRTGNKTPGNVGDVLLNISEGKHRDNQYRGLANAVPLSC